MLRSGRQLFLLLPLCALTLSGQQAPPDPQQAQPRPPVFRAGAHYVRVDAYPTAKDGKIVEGLTKDDFEVYEDGKLQTIESSEYITFDTWTPDGERKDPRTQQAAYDLAGDPTWRVFVIVIDRDAYGMEGQHYMRAPLHEFIDRNLGPRDLFGLLSSESSWTDLVLGQTTTAAKAVIDSRRWIFDDADYDERLLPYYECGLASLIGRKRLDETYELLEGLVNLLGLVRQEKKSIVLVSNGLAQSGPARNTSTAAALPRIPGVGITRGRIGELTRGDRVGSAGGSFCVAERMRLMNIDFAQRFRDLLKSARQGNVAFYPIAPAGLQGIPFKAGARGFDMAAYHVQNGRTDILRTLASETDGVAIVNTNDLAGGMRRIANDMRAYYVLGYYTTNTTWDGGIRSIKVRLKPKRETIRARRQYRGPTAADIAAFSAPAAARVPAPPTPEETALATLTRVRPRAPFAAYAARAAADLSVVLEVPPGSSAWPAGTEVSVMAESSDGEVFASGRDVLKAAGRLAIVRLPVDHTKAAATGLIRVRADGMVFTDRIAVPPPSSLVGDPIAFRNGTAAAILACARTDGIRFEWPLLGGIERKQVRLLDRRGQVLPIPLSVAEHDAKGVRHLVTEISLAPLGRGEYIIELTAGSGSVTERKLSAIQVK